MGHWGTPSGVKTVLSRWMLEPCAPWIVAEAFETDFNYKSIVKGGVRKKRQPLQPLPFEKSSQIILQNLGTFLQNYSGWLEYILSGQCRGLTTL